MQHPCGIPVVWLWHPCGVFGRLRGTVVQVDDSVWGSEPRGGQREAPRAPQGRLSEPARPPVSTTLCHSSTTTLPIFHQHPHRLHKSSRRLGRLSPGSDPVRFRLGPPIRFLCFLTRYGQQEQRHPTPAIVHQTPPLTSWRPAPAAAIDHRRLSRNLPISTCPSVVLRITAASICRSPTALRVPSSSLLQTVRSTCG